MTDTKPTGMTIPPSAEYMLPIVRNRLSLLEEAVEAFLSVMKTTGTERETAYNAFRALNVRCACAGFIDTYEETFAPRLEAFKKLHDAMTMDFETALICAPDTTDEHLQTWLPKLQERGDGK